MVLHDHAMREANKMTNKRISIYRTSSVNRILQTARENCPDKELSTKKGLANYLGIGIARLTNIECGFSIPPLELSLDWCAAVGDSEAFQMIQHIYGIGLPPTDPRLLDTTKQLYNLIKQCEEAVQSANKLMEYIRNIRPKKSISVDDIKRNDEIAKQIYDLKQASSITLNSLETQGLISSKNEVGRLWVQKARVDGILIDSFEEYETLRKKELVTK